MKVKLSLCVLFLVTASYLAFSQADTIITKSSIYIHGGGLISFLKQGKINTSPYLSFNAGFMFKRKIKESSSLYLIVSYQPKYINNLKTELYDLQYNKTVDLTTSFITHELEMPLIYTADINKISTGGGITLSYLMASTINQDASGDFGQVKNGIKSKYMLVNHRSAAPFNKINISPSLFFSYSFSKRIGISYLLSYELIKNPLADFSYFAQHNFINNKLLLTLKLK